MECYYNKELTSGQKDYDYSMCLLMEICIKIFICTPYCNSIELDLQVRVVTHNRRGSCPLNYGMGWGMIEKKIILRDKVVVNHRCIRNGKVNSAVFLIQVGILLRQ